jgi:fucose 4-O-acetylase-like acetyltransferase
MQPPVSLGGKRRIQFIDLAKGLCIIMVVLFHAGVMTPSTPLLSSLRMPLYFFLSGLFFKTYGGIVNFLVKKVNKILIPFVFFFVISKFFCLSRLVFVHDYNLASSLAFLGRFSLVHNIPLWFLVCLFVTNIIFCVLRRAIKNDVLFSLAIFACALVGVWYGENGVSGFAYSATAMTSLPFFYFGYMSNKTPWLYPGKYDKYCLPAAIVLIGAALTIVYFSGNAHISMRDNRFVGSALAAYMTAVLAVSGALMLCKAINRLPVVSYIGRYSIIVLGTHMIVMPFVQLWLNSTDILIGSTNYCLIAGFATLAVCLLLIPLFLRFAPQFTAQKDIFGEHTVKVLSKPRSVVHPRAMLRGLRHRHPSV